MGEGFDTSNYVDIFTISITTMDNETYKKKKKKTVSDLHY